MFNRRIERRFSCLRSKVRKLKRILTYIVLYVACVACASAQMKWSSAYQAYIDKYKDLAIEQMLEHNIPASITLAQGLLESGAGRSTMATEGNNHFGIKCHNDWTGGTMRRDDDAPNECFRVYRHARESYEDHSKFLKKQRYSRLFTYARTDYKSWAYGLKACGYATSPTYAQQLIGIIELYNLSQYDKATKYDRYIASHAGSNGQRGTIGHQIYYFNDNYYVKAKKGDTFKSIGKEVGVGYRKLARYNERDKRDVLSEGDIVYLKKKKSKAPKEFKYKPHAVKAGESMYDIAQMYGIRLAKLYKRNGLSPDFVPQVGDVLRVR